MNKQYVIILIIIGFILAFASCTDLKKDLPVATNGNAKIHDAGWSDEGSSNFHGRYLKAKEYNTDACTSCHAKNLLGGVSGVSCNKCHQSFPHSDGWEDDTSKTNFHGKYLKAKNWNSNECKNCHGAAYTGGTSGEACYQCHPSFPHEVKFAGEDGHENYMEQNRYPFSECNKCHGANLTGGAIADVSCSQSGCHSDAGGNTKSPEACNTCHGKFRAAENDTLSWAPPRALNGDTLETSPAVGAHQAHLAGGDISNLVKCNQCHQVPPSVSVSGHLDTPLPAEVKFDTTLAGLKTADGTFNPNPVFDINTFKCNNAYCHGAWKARKASASPTAQSIAYQDSIIQGASYSPLWTGGDDQAQCSSCHALPPQGHKSATSCFGCHYSSTTMDNTKHINGKINSAFGPERPF